VVTTTIRLRFYYNYTAPRIFMCPIHPVRGSYYATDQGRRLILTTQTWKQTLPPSECLIVNI